MSGEFAGSDEPRDEHIGHFELVSRELEAGKHSLEEFSNVLEEIADDLASKVAELEVYIIGNEHAEEHSLTPLASEQTIKKLESDITELRLSISKVEELQTKMISSLDRLEASEKRLLNIVINHPTDEPNPDDRDLK